MMTKKPMKLSSSPPPGRFSSPVSTSVVPPALPADVVDRDVKRLNYILKKIHK